MKTGIVTALIALFLPVTVCATSLRLSNDIDLLVLDGKKVSSSLLRVPTVLSWRMVGISLSFALRKRFVSPAMKNVCIFLLRWSSVLILSWLVRSIFIFPV